MRNYQSNDQWLLLVAWDNLKNNVCGKNDNVDGSCIYVLWPTVSAKKKKKVKNDNVIYLTISNCLSFYSFVYLINYIVVFCKMNYRDKYVWLNSLILLETNLLKMGKITHSYETRKSNWKAWFWEG